jgi:hypothetical protein
MKSGSLFYLVEQSLLILKINQTYEKDDTRKRGICECLEALNIVTTVF